MKTITVYEPHVKFSGQVELATINWSAIGAVDVATARTFALELLAACSEAERLNHDFIHNEAHL